MFAARDEALNQFKRLPHDVFAHSPVCGGLPVLAEFRRERRGG
jgi:hypothetical protein